MKIQSIKLGKNSNMMDKDKMGIKTLKSLEPNCDSLPTFLNFIFPPGFMSASSKFPPIKLWRTKSGKPTISLNHHQSPPRLLLRYCMQRFLPKYQFTIR